MNDSAEHPLLAHPEQYKLGETRENIYLENAEHNRIAAQMLLEQTSYRFYVLNRDLDPDVFSTLEFAESLARLCRHSRHTDVRFLIADDRKLIHRTHRLLDPIRQYSSYVGLRLLPRRFSSMEENYILVDDGGVLHRPSSSAYQGKLNFHNPNQYKELKEEFIRLWDRSEPDPNVRQLSY